MSRGQRVGPQRKVGIVSSKDEWILVTRVGGPPQGDGEDGGHVMRVLVQTCAVTQAVLRRKTARLGVRAPRGLSHCRCGAALWPWATEVPSLGYFTAPWGRVPQRC